MGLGGDEMRGTARVYIERCNHHILWHLFSFLCPSIYSASSTLVNLTLYVSLPPTPSLRRMQTEGASGVEVLLAFGPPLGPSSAQRFRIASAASGFPKPSRVSTIHSAV